MPKLEELKTKTDNRGRVTVLVKHPKDGREMWMRCHPGQLGARIREWEEKGFEFVLQAKPKPAPKKKAPAKK